MSLSPKYKETSLDTRIEKGSESSRQKPEDFDSSESLQDNDIVVDWDGPKDPQNPRNWSKKQRWIVTLVVSLFTFIRYATWSVASMSKIC